MQRADEFACMRPHPDGDPAFPRGRRGTSAYPLCASLTFPRQKFALLPTFKWGAHVAPVCYQEPELPHRKDGELTLPLPPRIMSGEPPIPHFRRGARVPRRGARSQNGEPGVPFHPSSLQAMVSNLNYRRRPALPVPAVCQST